MEQNSWGWSDRLSLSYEPMDETHKEFVELCAALSEDNPDTFLNRLDALIAHSIVHFEQENHWMEETAFPPVGCHRQEHEAVLEVMQEVRRRVALGETDLAARLAEELPLWFEHHVDTMDNMLARFMAAGQATPLPDQTHQTDDQGQAQPA
ncbi:hemerythrin domain-containing protein [Undibacterium sp. Ji50W]|uniref:hemerythrin domain-containing protein n=1 Tax=Undibacterium sp. Ji50W TaxID=3413041 RepID=UPI003BF40DF6